MLSAVLSLAAIFVFLALTEVVWRKKKLVNEIPRQIVHVVVGVFIAFWPYYMSYRTIVFCAIALLAVLLIGRYDNYLNFIKRIHFFPFTFVTRELKFIESIHKVKRASLGDLIFPFSIGFLALFEPARYVFTIAILTVALADGLAAVAGYKFRKSRRYQLFTQTKSVAGTLTFWAVSLLILLVAKLMLMGQGSSITWLTLLYLPPVLALTENFAVFGTDDFMIPMIVLAALSWI